MEVRSVRQGVGVGAKDIVDIGNDLPQDSDRILI